MTCPTCGRTHDPKRCTGHVDRDPKTGDPIQVRPCGAYPVRGATVCVSHGGGAPQVRQAAERRLERLKLRAEVARDFDRLGVVVDLEDGEAIRAMRDEAAGNVIVLRRLIQKLDLGVSGVEYDPETKQFYPPAREGIAGRTYHQSGIQTGEAKPHVLVAMYDSERDRLAKLDEACVKLGLEAKRVALEEDRAARLAIALERVLVRAGVDTAAIDVRSWLAEELEAS